ncbi:MAG: DUF2461 domain-containing protein [Clostridia bacterium]|nr:DUF2461 domain-containing protein [Clostridia bacterium]
MTERTFQGFTDETYEFFMAIAFNNNMQFFHENHDWYLRAVRQPCLDLAAALDNVMEKIDDEIERRPNRVVSRINRDIRFSNDKSPYRDHLWISFQRPSEERGREPGFWFEIDAHGASWGVGAYAVTPGFLRSYRRLLLESPERVLLAAGPALKRFELFGQRYKRLPVPDDLRPELRPLWDLKALGFERTTDDQDLLDSPRLVDVLSDDYVQLAPMYHLMRFIRANETA